MYFNGDIIITDPCYILNSTDWSEFADNYDFDLSKFGIKNAICDYNGVGDISSSVYITANQYNIIDKVIRAEYNEESDDRTKFEDIVDNLDKYGEFTADSGMVCICYLNEVMKYNPDFKSFLDKNNNNYTLIKKFTGDVDITSVKHKLYNNDYGCTKFVIGKGNINFLSIFN